VSSEGHAGFHRQRANDRAAEFDRITRPARCVSDQFSPLMSCTIADPGQVSNVGTTRPTPLPLRVGAKQKRD